MSEPRYETGKAGKLLINSIDNFFAEWDMTIEKRWATATDSSGFDPTNRQLWDKWAAGGMGGSGSIIGFYDFNAGSSPLLATLLQDSPIPVIFKYDEVTTFGSGLVVIKNFKTGVKVDGGETIGFTCDYQTYGVFSPVA